MYLNSNEFIFALTQLNGWKRRRSDLEDELKRLDYLRFRKVKSPNDYDVIGYEGKEAIREQKARSYVSEYQRMERWEEQDRQIEEVKSKIASLDSKIAECESAFNSLDDPLKGMCNDKYIRGKTFESIAPRYGFSASGMFKYMMRELNDVFNK